MGDGGESSKRMKQRLLGDVGFPGAALPQVRNSSLFIRRVADLENSD